MSFALRRALRYARGWLREPAGLARTERTLDLPGRRVPATVLRPASTSGPLPAWVVLHGVTRPGREHPQLVRFTRALASTGAVVIVPEVPEWIALELRPGPTGPTVEAALDFLAEDPDAAPGRSGLVGFSFGAPQAILAASRPGVADRVSSVVAFGGYCDLPRTVRFQMTGWHEWEGIERRRRPDPYGRWIIAGNFLTGVPGHEDAGAVSAALLELAAAAGDARTPSWDPVYDPVKARLRAGLGPDERALFDRFAPPSAEDPPPDSPEAVEWSERLAAAAARAEPALDAVAEMGTLHAPVHVLHGQDDALIPSTEARRLGVCLEPHARVHVTVTGLFGHSQGSQERPGIGETLTFVAALARLLGSV